MFSSLMNNTDHLSKHRTNEINCWHFETNNQTNNLESKLFTAKINQREG